MERVVGCDDAEFGIGLESSGGKERRGWFRLRRDASKTRQNTNECGPELLDKRWYFDRCDASGACDEDSRRSLRGGHVCVIEVVSEVGDELDFETGF